MTKSKQDKVFDNILKENPNGHTAKAIREMRSEEKKIVPKFGDKDQIELIRLEKALEGVKEIKGGDCTCSCGNEHETYACPHCDEKDPRDGLFVEVNYNPKIFKCTNCEKKVAYYSPFMRLAKLKKKVNSNQE